MRLALDLGLQRRLTGALATVLRGVPGQPRGDLGGSVVLDPRNGQVLAMASLPSYDSRVFGPPVHNKRLARLSRRPASPMLEHVDAGGGPARVDLQAGRRRGEHAARARPAVPGAARRRLLDPGQPHLRQLDVPARAEPAARRSRGPTTCTSTSSPGPWARGRSSARPGAWASAGPRASTCPAETGGYLGTPASVARAGGTWYAGSTVILGIGQGYLTVTPLQDALWTAGVATGAMVTPHLGLAYREGAGPSRLPWPRPHRLSYAGKLGPVRAGMALAATSGTASILTALPVRPGAKTGSAEDPSAPNGAPDSWFTAAAPLAAPAHGGDVVRPRRRPRGEHVRRRGAAGDAVLLRPRAADPARRTAGRRSTAWRHRR